ncbi:discoidin domain-containing protein, partial [Trueperella bernardiae]
MAYADSVETTGEGANGPAKLVLDGNTDTYWHTKWNPAKDPLPHKLVVDLGESVEGLGRIVLTPRQSSNGSGRFGNFNVSVSTDAECANPEAYASKDSVPDFESVADESIPAAPDAGKLAPVNVDFEPTAARCVAVTINSTWGGNDSAEQVAALSEFAAFTAAENEPGTEPEPAAPLEVVIPEGAPEITDGQLTVHTHPAFPQVVDYQLGEKQMPGKFGDALTSVNIDGKATPVVVGDPSVSADKTAVTYPVSLPSVSGSFDVVISVKDQVLDYRITNITDPEKKINRIQIPGLDLVSLDSVADATAMVGGARINTNRAANPDSFLTVASTADTTARVWMAVAAGNGLAAGFETNAIDDQTAVSGTSGNDRYTVQVREQNGNRIGTISPYEWVH